MNKPQVKTDFGKFSFTWPELEVSIEVDHLSNEGTGELHFWHTNGTGRKLLHFAKANLLSTPTCSQLAKRLKENVNIDWTTMLTYVSSLSLDEYRRGEPTEEIWPKEDDCLEVEYLLNPLLYLNHPTVFFGDYGSLKSLMALTTAYVVQLPYEDNNLGLTTTEQPSTCLYLDYEDDPSSFRRRWSALRLGFGKAAMPILYRRMTTPLADSVEAVHQIIIDKGAKLLIVDSLGPAARGNLNDPEPAIRYHTALRQLGITSLTLAHTSKDQLTRKRTIFGSVFFTNLARSVWECKSEQETGEDEAIISLKHTKANLSKLHLPLGYRFTFTNNTITVTSAELRGTGLSGDLPLSLKIKDLLRHGAMPIKEIAQAMEANEPSVRTAINRMGKRGELIKVGESWGLKER